MLAVQGLPAHADTVAGIVIANTARVRYDLAGKAGDAPSNTDSFAVAERLDVALVREGKGALRADGDTPVAFMLTNGGNGEERFALIASAGQDGTVETLAVDSDNDGRYDAAHDLPLTDGRTPVLAAGSSVRLFALLRPSGVPSPDAVLTLEARAATGSGTPGTLFQGQGDGGGDAVVGPTGAAATLAVPFGASVAPSLIKSQAVLAPDGSASPVRGAVVTYTLEARFPAPAQAARVADPLPAGVAYVPGSLMLDGRPISDPADGDAGQADAAAIAVALGDVPAAAVHTVQFQAKIQ